MKLPPIGPLKDNTKFSSLPFDDGYRRPVMFDLGCGVKGVSCPHPDMDHPLTVEAGVRKRFASAPPESEKTLVDELRQFVKTWLRSNLQPLPSDSDTSVNKWLDQTNYPMWRKINLKGKFVKIRGVLQRKHYKVKSFIKDETYPEYKHARGINSRSDEFKVKVGPIFKLIEQEVFKLHYFIKKIPVADRPAYIKEKILRSGNWYFASDYTAFESLFTRELMEAVEFELYDYMTSLLPEHDEFMGIITEAMLGVNDCSYKRLRVLIDATRMSGEMCTSLGNGFSNLMFMLFMCQKVGCRDVDGVVEGDDGLFTGSGAPPKSEDFEKLGLRIKIGMYDQLSEASFCGLVFDKEDCNNVTDPRDVLATFGFSNIRYLLSKRSRQLSLLRCKSLSLAHQYPGCPIISSLAQYGLRATRHITISKRFMDGAPFSMWERDQVLAALKDEKNIVVKPVGINTRCLVEKLYSIPVATQLLIEKYLDSLDQVTPLDHPSIQMIMPDCWKHYDALYCKYVDRKFPFNRPGLWAQLEGFCVEWRRPS